MCIVCAVQPVHLWFRPLVFVFQVLIVPHELVRCLSNAIAFSCVLCREPLDSIEKNKWRRIEGSSALEFLGLDCFPEVVMDYTTRLFVGGVLTTISPNRTLCCVEGAPPAIPTMSPNLTDGKLRNISLATTAAEVVPYLPFGREAMTIL